MTKFHRNFNIMSMFTATLLAVVMVFWHTFMNIAVSNVFLNGIIIGTTIFGIGVCFAQMFRLLPEYRWLHAYFDGQTIPGFTPKVLRPIAVALNNRHTQITTSSLSELLDLVAGRIDSERDSVQYITNALIFLGLLGTFWGLIITIGGFAELLLNLDLNNDGVLESMQMGMTLPLSGMATAFTSSLLGLIGSLSVGFLGLQLQFAQNTIFEDLTDFMTQYVLQTPGTTNATIELSNKAPVSEAVYTNITKIYDIFTDADYEIRDLIRIDGKYPAVVALGTHEKLFIGTVGVDDQVLKNTLKRIELCFADTLEGLNIDTRILCIGNGTSDSNKIIHFESASALKKYMSTRKNIRPESKSEIETFDAYSEYIGVAMKYLFKTDKE